MTAPRRRNGILVTTIERGCESKTRYSDEYAARAAGQAFVDHRGVPLFIYSCGICRGWHITRRPQRNDWQSVNFSYALRER